MTTAEEQLRRDSIAVFNAITEFAQKRLREALSREVAAEFWRSQRGEHSGAGASDSPSRRDVLDLSDQPSRGSGTCMASS